MIAPSIAGVILAAGASSRMGRDKALLPWPRAASASTLLAANIESLKPFTQFVLVVAGDNAAALQPVAYARGAFVVANPKPERGQFSSLRVGLHEVLNRGRDAAFITHADRIPASPQTLQRLLDRFRAELRKPERPWAVVPQHAGAHGHPIVIGREMIEAFLRAPEDSTARDVEHQHQSHIAYLDVDDPRVLENVNTPEEYQAALLRAEAALR